MYLVYFIEQWFSVEFSDIVEAFKTFLVALMCEVELRGFDEEEGHQEEYYER